jgi:glucose uptake protein GlcU
MLSTIQLIAAKSSGFHIGTRYYLIAAVVVVAVGVGVYLLRKRKSKKD